MNTMQTVRQHTNRSQAMPGASASGPHTKQLGMQKPPADQRRDRSSSTADAKPADRALTDAQASRLTSNQAHPPATSTRGAPREPLRTTNKITQQSRPRAHSTSITKPAASSTPPTIPAETKQDGPLSDNKGLRNAVNTDHSRIPRAAHGQRPHDSIAAPNKAPATNPVTGAPQLPQTHRQSNSKNVSTGPNADNTKAGSAGKPEAHAGKRGAASLSAPAHNKSRPVTPVDGPAALDTIDSKGARETTGKLEAQEGNTDGPKQSRRTKTPQPSKETTTNADPQASAKGAAGTSQQHTSRPASPSGPQNAKPAEPTKKQEFVPKERVSSELSRVRPYSDGFFEGTTFGSKFS